MSYCALQRCLEKKLFKIDRAVYVSWMLIWYVHFSVCCNEPNPSESVFGKWFLCVSFSDDWGQELVRTSCISSNNSNKQTKYKLKES